LELAAAVHQYLEGERKRNHQFLWEKSDKANQAGRVTASMCPLLRKVSRKSCKTGSRRRFAEECPDGKEVLQSLTHTGAVFFFGGKAAGGEGRDLFKITTHSNDRAIEFQQMQNERIN
jgi:hypothetical protein